MKIINFENKGRVSQKEIILEIKEKALKGGYYVHFERHENNIIRTIKLYDIFTDLQENTEWRFNNKGVIRSMCIFRGGTWHGEYIRYKESCGEMFIRSVSMWKEGEIVSYDNTVSCHVRTPREFRETDETRFLKLI